MRVGNGRDRRAIDSWRPSAPGSSRAEELERRETSGHGTIDAAAAVASRHADHVSYSTGIQASFNWRIFLKNDTIALSLLFGN